MIDERTMLSVLNALLHSRKFQAYAISLSIAILIPLANRWMGLGLDPTVVSSLVLGSVFGGASYGVATGIEDGKKAQAAAIVEAANPNKE